MPACRSVAAAARPPIPAPTIAMEIVAIILPILIPGKCQAVIGLG
jgi:hypothetical protein